MKIMKISIVQPSFNHYRESFYVKLNKYIDFDLLEYYHQDEKEAFNISTKIKTNKLNTISFGGFTLFNIFNKKLLKNKIIVIGFDPRCLSLYALLILNLFLRKKIILWTHGVSIHNGFNPKSFRDQIKISLFNLADGICFYTNNELELFSEYLHKPETFYINNTLDVEKINKNYRKLHKSKEELKKTYNINSSRVVIFCARFIEDRRADILIEFIESMSNKDVSFIIIGDGVHKPDFSNYDKVFDFGKIYDEDKKSELFKIADFCFQPAWSGLSVLESFAHEVPFITMKKSQNIKQCVEYNYIEHGKNGFIFESLNDVKELVCKISDNEMQIMKNYCRNKTQKDLSMDLMVKKFYDGILLLIEGSD